MYLVVLSDELCEQELVLLLTQRSDRRSAGDQAESEEGLENTAALFGSRKNQHASSSNISNTEATNNIKCSSKALGAEQRKQTPKPASNFKLNLHIFGTPVYHSELSAKACVSLASGRRKIPTIVQAYQRSTTGAIPDKSQASTHFNHCDKPSSSVEMSRNLLDQFPKSGTYPIFRPSY